MVSEKGQALGFRKLKGVGLRRASWAPRLIDWEAKDDKKIQDFNYRATKEALARAVKGEPKASEVTAKKDSAHHPFAAS